MGSVTSVDKYSSQSFSAMPMKPTVLPESCTFLMMWVYINSSTLSDTLPNSLPGFGTLRFVIIHFVGAVFFTNACMVSMPKSRSWLPRQLTATLSRLKTAGIYSPLKMVLKILGENKSPEKRHSFLSFPCCSKAVTKRAAPARIPTSLAFSFSSML